LSAFAAWALFEFLGQKVFFRGTLYFVDDVDHRLAQGDKPGLNSDGIRCSFEASDFIAEDLNFIILGDSFIYGTRMEPQHSVPQRFEEHANAQFPTRTIRVANFGWVSSSPLLSLRQLKDIGAKYKPDIVLLAVDMTDFHDDIKYRRLLDRQGIYWALDYIPVTIMALRKLTPGIESLHHWLFQEPGHRFFITEGPLEETLPHLSHIQNNLDQIQRFCQQELDARFVLFVFPRSYQYSDREAPNNWEQDEYENLGPHAHEPVRYFEQVRSRVEYPIYSLLPDFLETDLFPTVLDDDPHWNKAGNDLAAGAMLRYCVEAGCFE
jgi:hypothetical protein